MNLKSKLLMYLLLDSKILCYNYYKQDNFNV